MARLCHVFLPKETSPLRSQADWPSSVAGKLKRAQCEVSVLQAANDRFQSRRGCRDGSISNFDLCRILAPAAAQTRSDAFCRCGSRDAADAGDMRPRDRRRPRLRLRIGLQSSLGVCAAARVVQPDGRGFAVMLKTENLLPKGGCRKEVFDPR